MSNSNSALLLAVILIACLFSFSDEAILDAVSIFIQQMGVTVPMNCISEYLHKLSATVNEPKSLRKIFHKIIIRVFSLALYK
jgi:hypothetical protein